MESGASIKLMNVKGGYDYLPSVLATRNYVVDKLRRQFERFGYLPLETTILCYYDLLSYKYAGGAEILKEVYALKDQGDRELGLRYDLTVPFCKVIGMNRNITMPFKRYEIGKVFRDGPVKLGRGREFYQCDVDAVGIKGQIIEAEIINLAVIAYKEIGIEPEVHYSNRKFLNGIIVACGIAPEHCSEVILEVDKLEKTSIKAVKANILKLSETIKGSMADDLLEALHSSVSDLNERFAEVEGTKEGLAELLALEDAINRLGISDNCKFSPSLARGLEIYTGSVWEVFDKQRRLESSLGGGGRYDKIITNFMNNGTEYPAVGISFGLEPICAVLNHEKQESLKLIDLYLIPLDDKISAMSFANKLRNSGICTLVEMTGKKLNKCFSYANSEGFHYVAVIGEDEIKSGQIKIKDMQSGESTAFSFDDIEGIASFVK